MPAPSRKAFFVHLPPLLCRSKFYPNFMLRNKLSELRSILNAKRFPIPRIFDYLIHEMRHYSKMTSSLIWCDSFRNTILRSSYIQSSREIASLMLNLQLYLVLCSKKDNFSLSFKPDLYKNLHCLIRWFELSLTRIYLKILDRSIWKGLDSMLVVQPAKMLNTHVGACRSRSALTLWKLNNQASSP